MIKQLITKLLRYIFDECPDCGYQLDRDWHGYEQKWGHCRNCGYCTYDQHFERSK